MNECEPDVISEQNQIVKEISFKTTNVSFMVASEKVVLTHPLGIMNVCRKFYGNQFHVCRYISVWKDMIKKDKLLF